TAIYNAARALEGVRAETTRYGSRKRAAAIELGVSAEQRPGRRLTNSGYYGAGYDYAATWDEWGVIFAAIFEADANATCAAYEDGYDFHWQTDDRFIDGTMPEHRHDMHRWQYTGAAGRAANSYAIYTCKGRKGDPCD